MASACTMTRKEIRVGRFTDPDVMAKAIGSGQCDIIGTTRSSIADPFLRERRRLDSTEADYRLDAASLRWN